MGALEYVGATQSASTDLVTRVYVDGLLTTNLSQSAVDAQITSGLSSYVTKSYVDTQDALNATKSFIDTADALKLHLNQVNVNSGIAGLDASGRIDVARVSIASTQRWPTPFTSPSAYHTSLQSSSTSETQLYTITVADPGYAYRLFLSGAVDTQTDTAGQYPIVRVRRGSNTGPIVGVGNGPGEMYFGTGVGQQFTTSGTYTVPSGYTDLDVIVLGAGGGPSNFFANLGGAAGSFGTAHLLYGSTLPLTTTTLAVNIGTGAGPGGNGGDSTVSGTGVTTVTGSGGPTSASPIGAGGASPGTTTFDGQPYAGGAASAAGAAGVAPGGGGGSDGGTGGGTGARGQVWFLAYSSTSTPAGPAIIFSTPLDQQSTLTGATTLYVMLSRHASTGTVKATTVKPTLMAVPIPA